MFKLGFCYMWGAEELEGSLRKLAALRYDGVEFWDGLLQQVEIPRLAELLQRDGLDCAQICPYFNFVDGQELWDNSMRIAEQYIAWATQLPGTPLIRVFTGRPWGGGEVGPDDATPAQWDAAISGLQRICDMAAPHGVRLALECHTGSLMEDTPSTLRLLHGVNRPNLGVNLQLPLKSGKEPIEVSLDALGKYTWHSHAHNFTALESDQMVPLGEGVMDYQMILTRLMADGFNGYVSIEHANYGGTRDPWEVAAHEAVYLQQLREELA